MSSKSNYGKYAASILDKRALVELRRRGTQDLYVPAPALSPKFENKMSATKKKNERVKAHVLVCRMHAMLKERVS